VSIGICIRDARGQHVLSKIMWFTPLCSIDIGEALRLYNAIVENLSLNKSKFHTTCSIIMNQ